MANLTRRETDVLQLVALGLTDKEIGERLHTSHWTVKTQLKSIYRKLEARNRAHAVATYLQRKGVPV